jgi:hypothetical protein
MTNLSKTANGKFCDELLAYWRTMADITILPPASENAVLEFERFNHVHCPDDFRAFFLNCANGFDQFSGCCDESGFNFLPIADICNPSSVFGSASTFEEINLYFVFCGYLDFSWAYAISLRESCRKGEIVIVGTRTGHPVFVAKNFSDFIALYLKDDSLLYAVG